jgi:hypothetical protein
MNGLLIQIDYKIKRERPQALPFFHASDGAFQLLPFSH